MIGSGSGGLPWDVSRDCFAFGLIQVMGVTGASEYGGHGRFSRAHDAAQGFGAAVTEDAVRVFASR